MIMFSVGRFTCKERVMLIEREMRLLFLCKQESPLRILTGHSDPPHP